jgi:hypothetical protein
MPNISNKHAEEGAAEELEKKVEPESTDTGEATHDLGAGNH